MRNGARQPLAVRPEQLPPLLFETLPALRLMGVRTVLPRALERLWRPRLSMQIKAAGSSMPGVLTTDTLLSFDWKVSIGDELLTAAEFERLLGKADGIVRFRGQYVMLDAAQVVPTSLFTNWQKEAARFTPGLSVDVFHGGKR